MDGPNLQCATPQRIVIFRALQLGDMLCAVPAFRALRRGLPDANVTLVGLPWAHELLRRFPRYLDCFIEFPGFPGLPERDVRPCAAAMFLQQMQEKRFDLAIQLHGSGQLSNPIVSCFDAKRGAGFFDPEHDYCPDPSSYFPYPGQGHEIHRCLKLMQLLGFPADDDRLEFPVLGEDERILDRCVPGWRPGKYLCIHPGARHLDKRWPVGHFARVADALADSGLDVIITGCAAEHDLAQQMQERMRTKTHDITGLDLPLGPLAALLKSSRLVVCNDTGISHLATALNVPSVVIFSTTDQERWAPLSRSLHRSLRSSSQDGVSVESVVREARYLLGLTPREQIHGVMPAQADIAVDVLIPTYHRPAALAVTLTSLCAQACRDFRLIVSDQTDGFDSLSQPEVQTPLRLLSARGCRVERHRHLPRRGMAEHRQFLLDQVTAPYCLYLDDDLILEPDVIERLLRAMREERCGFVGSAVIGLSYLDDLRPEQQAIEFWEGPVRPEKIRPGMRQWERYHLHSAANLYHVQRRLGLSPGEQRKYRVAWIGACVLYDTGKLREVGGFTFWRDLPREHCGEDVLVQCRLMESFGGCGIIPSGVYHQELPTTIPDRHVDAPYYLKL